MGELAKRALTALGAARSGPPEIWISIFDEDTVLAAVTSVQARLDAGEALPLAGLTVAVKDNIDVAGLPTTAACPAYAYLPSRSAPAVAALTGAGAVVIGKTNMDQFATGLVGTRSPYGMVRNAIDPRYIAGGSSSGSAVAVALGQVDLALATDTAGSGRVPAALNGIVGFKPTRALVSRAGVVPASPSYDCVSVMASDLNTARLAATALGVPSHLAGRPLRTAGVPAGDLGLDGERRALWDAAVGRLSASGVSVETVDVTDFLGAGALLYGGALVAERYAAVGDFAVAHAAEVDPVVLQILLDASAVPAHRLVRDLARLAEIQARVAERFSGLDALMVPTTRGHPTIAEVLADPTGPNDQLGRYNHFCNPLDLAAVTLPAGCTASGLPFGVNLYAPGGSDASLLDLAARYAGEIPGVPTESAGTLLAVAGAHLRGQPLNPQLLELGARFAEQTTTAARYRFYALPTDPPKPGLVRVPASGAPIEVELWSMDERNLVRMASSIAWPLALGAVELADGRQVIGFVCQAGAESHAIDITSYGGWRTYLRSMATTRSP